MAGLPPPPLQDPQGSFGWLEWYRQLRDYISTASSIPWNIIQFAGSKLTDLQQRSHGDLQNIQGGTPSERYHLTAAEVATISSGITTLTITSTAVDYTVLTTDNVIKVTAASKTVTLLTAVGNLGRVFTVNNASTGICTVACTGGQTINTSVIQILPAKSSMTVYSDNTNWQII